MDELLVCPKTVCGEPRDLLRPRERDRPHLGRRYDTVQPAELEETFGGEGALRPENRLERDVQRQRLCQLAREQRGEAEPSLGDPEGRGTCGDPDIAHLGETPPTRQAVAVDRRDRRLPQLRVDHVPAKPVDPLVHLLRASGEPGEVVADLDEVEPGREEPVSGARDDHRTDAFVVAKLLPEATEIHAHRVRERVRRRMVDRDGSDAGVADLDREPRLTRREPRHVGHPGRG